MIVVLLPAFNEEDSLPRLLPKIQKVLVGSGELFRVLVCNDGSQDRTQEILEAWKEKIPLEILDHRINRGLGESVRDLFERAAQISDKGDVIVRLDCDDTHEPEFIPAIVEKVRTGYDVVVASRFLPGGGQSGVSPYRACISLCANIFMRILFRIPRLKEYSCGFRGYRAEKIKEAIEIYGNNFIQLKGLGFTCTLEKLVKLSLIGASFMEIPFQLRYDQKQSESKMIGSVTTLGYMVMALLYYWPWGGWRMAMRRKHTNWRVSNDRP